MTLLILASAVLVTLAGLVALFVRIRHKRVLRCKAEIVRGRRCELSADHHGNHMINLR